MQPNFFSNEKESFLSRRNDSLLLRNRLLREKPTKGNFSDVFSIESILVEKTNKRTTENFSFWTWSFDLFTGKSIWLLFIDIWQAKQKVKREKKTEMPKTFYRRSCWWRLSICEETKGFCDEKKKKIWSNFKMNRKCLDPNSILLERRTMALLVFSSVLLLARDFLASPVEKEKIC